MISTTAGNSPATFPDMTGLLGVHPAEALVLQLDVPLQLHGADVGLRGSTLSSCLSVGCRWAEFSIMLC